MQILITERNDITPLFRMDLLKKFKLTIGKLRLDLIRVKQKARPKPLHLQENVGKEIEKVI